jgi:hypothetical protein
MGRAYVGGGTGYIDTGAGGGGAPPGPNPTWLVPDWHVNWLTGHDANDGLTPATAVKTIATC